VLHEAPHIERFGSAITVCAAVAPLLGLLGTVTGMIATFGVITEHGTGDPKLLSTGISEALVTTELGLVVAIPTLLLGSLLSARASALLATMERAALRIMNLAWPSTRSTVVPLERKAS
jgi:biopolymer transport protein ExbB